MNFQVTTKHMKRCSAHNRHSSTVGLCEFFLKSSISLVSREMKIRTTVGLGAFTNREVGAWRAMGRGGARSDSGAHGRPLLTASRRTDWTQGWESGTRYR